MIGSLKSFVIVVFDWDVVVGGGGIAVNPRVVEGHISVEDAI